MIGIPDFGKLTMRLFGSVARTEHLVLQEYKVKKGSRITRKSKHDVILDTGVVVMAARKGQQKRYSLDVPYKARIKPGSIILMGTNRQLDEFGKYARKKKD